MRKGNGRAFVTSPDDRLKSSSNSTQSPAPDQARKRASPFVRNRAPSIVSPQRTAKCSSFATDSFVRHHVFASWTTLWIFPPGATFVTMYIDSRPASVFKHTSGWNMPTPQPPGTLKRPPIRNAGAPSSSSPGERPPLSQQSSSSSLSAYPQDAPSFQSFVQRNASIDSDQNKPLPPRPIAPNESSGSSNDRRSSSVYSRTPSQPQTPRWASYDSEADSPLVVRPMAYSASSPDLTPPLLEARTFSPLIESPRSTTIASNSPSRSRSHSMLATAPSGGPHSPTVPRISISTIDTWVAPAPPRLTSPIAHHGARRPVHTVSLEKAKEAMHAPGAVRLLPEELRAQALKKVNSYSHMRVDSIDVFGSASKPPIPPAVPTMIDYQGRERALRTPLDTPRAEYAFPSPSLPKTSAAYISLAVGSGPVREMAPPLANSPSETKITWQQMSQENIHEPRGRTVERRSYEKKSKSGQKTSGKGARQDDFAGEYHSLLSQQQYRQASESPGSSSDNSVRTHMKMVPQPLFQAKQPPRSIQSVSSRGSNSNSSVLPFNIHQRIGSGASTSSTNRSPGFGLRLSVETSENKSRHSSTTGMIPISPPMDHDVQRPNPPNIVPDQWHPNPRIGRSNDRQNSRESSFYPHVFPRKNSKKKDINLGKPLLTTSVIAQRLKTPDATPDTSPLQNSLERRASSVGGGGEEKDKKKCFGRFGGKSRRRSSVQSTVSSTQNASPSSPHLFPSPAKTTANTNAHLGWSSDAKATFDEARSPTTSTRIHYDHPRLTHITTPARPLDGGRDEEEPESPTTPTSPRRGNLFGSVLEGWREGKAARRREDLKRLIRVLPAREVGEERKSVGIARAMTGTGDGGERRSVGVGVWRRNSAAGWM